jgi:hypothetical protein
MKGIRSYPTRLDADLARIALEAAGVPAVVVGTGWNQKVAYRACSCWFQMIASPWRR